MERNRQRELALAAVTVALIGFVVWRLQPGAAPTTAAAPATPATQVRAQAGAKSPMAQVDLQSLKGDRPEPVESTRNPFRFRAKPAPPPATPTRGAGAPQGTTPENGMPPGPPAPPPPPRIALKFIGVVQSEDPKFKEVAVLSDARGVYHGRVGEVIEGRYRIVRIGVESIELAYLDGRGSQTIAKTGQ